MKEQEKKENRGEEKEKVQLTKRKKESGGEGEKRGEEKWKRTEQKKKKQGRGEEKKMKKNRCN